MSEKASHPTNVSGSLLSRKEIWDSIRWRRVDIRGSVLDATSTSAQNSPCSEETLLSSTKPSSVPQYSNLPSSSNSASTSYTVITHAANLPASLPTSASTAIFVAPVYGPVADFTTSFVSSETEGSSSLDIPSPSSDTQTQSDAVITHVTNLPVSGSLPDSASTTIRRVPIYGTVVEVSAGTSPSGTDAASSPEIPTPSSPNSVSTTKTETTPPTSATTIFWPGSVTGTFLVSSLPDESSSVSVSSDKIRTASLGSDVPTNSLGSAAGGYTGVESPSATLSFSLFFPVESVTTTGTTVSSPVLATSGSLSRTFAHNTAGIAGVALGATFALLLGVLLTFFACRRFKKSRKVSASWISPPLLQEDDGLADAYSPVVRRRPRRESAGFTRPVSIQPLEHLSAPDVAAGGIDTDAHYDVDTWGSVPVAPNSPSRSYLPPTSASPAMFSIPLPGEPQHIDPQPVISAKGFMRRLRRGRPSLASHGLLTTLAPVPESPNSPAMSTAKISRPPSSLLGSLLHNPVSVAQPSPALPGPEKNSLPWIHRTRGSVKESSESAPPSAQAS
ncbi:hypothetical protein C8R43DRAFT_486815 [Mycena crocata]|nr:hypothetical protein C8R43DRAFT_486815 [Mycena crocata]